MFKVLIFLFCLCATAEAQHSSDKVLICGICRNIEATVANTIRNIEALGNRFDDYRAIIYENNSNDRTRIKLAAWASWNDRVIFHHENITKEEELAISRTEKIARARNKVLDIVRSINYEDYKYLIMVDLDFQYEWPIDEILNTIASPLEWDCISSNGIVSGDKYYDTYPYRSLEHPFGIELLGNQWWLELCRNEFSLKGENWIPVHSAFGGLSIYKTLSIIPFSYSGVVTEDLKEYYRQIFASMPSNLGDYRYYLQINRLSSDLDPNNIPIIFRHNHEYQSPNNYPFVTCCEHVTLHASMAIRGYIKFFINPKMIMRL